MKDKSLVTVADETILEVFSKEQGLDIVVDQAREVVSGFVHDLSTAAGRQRTASLANKVATLKVRMDGLGKSLTEDWAKKKKAVDNNRKKLRDDLDELKKVARQPLSKWEEDQLARIRAKQTDCYRERKTRQ